VARLTEVTASHFRSWRRMRLALDGRPVAVHGPNGAGKTNLIEAVSLLSPGRGLRRAEAADLARTPEHIGWRVSGAIETAQGPVEAVVLAEADGRKRVEIDGKPATQAALGAALPMLWLTPAMDGLWTGSAEERRRFLDRATLAFFPEHATAASAYDRAMRERNRLLKDGPRDPRWLAALEGRMAESGVAVAAARVAATARLRAARSDPKSLFPKAEMTILGWLEERIAPGSAGEAQVTALAEEFRAALEAGRRADEAAGRTLIGPHRADLSALYAAKGMEARSCSTGEQKALLISLTLDTARAIAAATGAPPALLLDEVAAHLDAGRRAALYEELVALRAQAFLTGAGRELFDALGDRAMRVAVADGPEGSTLTVED
jgi:DNA replication and repair protein RecF